MTLTSSTRVPVVSLVGRPNVGKSTLFNRLARRRLSLVHDEPGVTRDRLYATIDWLGRPVQLIDTGGMEPSLSTGIMRGILEQTKMAIAESDLVVWMVDGVSGPMPADDEIAQVLRRSRKPVIVVVNKCEAEKVLNASHEFYTLGFGHCISISAAHGRGMDEFFEAVVAKLPAAVEIESQETPPEIAVAIIGKPNAGKSSYLNKLLGEDRHLVSDEPGTTIDTVDSYVDYAGRRFRLIDTAGIRRKRSIYRDVEKMAVSASLGALDRCAVALLFIDAMEGLTEQDLKVASFAEKKGKGVVIVVNKWDLAKKQPGASAEKYADDLRDQMPFLAYAPIRFVSALTGSRVFDVLETVIEVADEYYKRVTTGQVNKLIEAAQEAHQAPVMNGRRIKIYYATQVSVAPPTFMLTCNDPDGIHFSYKRYLINQIRETFGFKGSPVRLVLRARDKAKNEAD